MDENELKILTELSKNSGASQRELSKTSNLSLGMVNIVLHRLIEKGYMKIKQLDGRKVQYILTPKGFTEKIEKSTNYVKKTINSVSLMKTAIRNIIEARYNKGIKTFSIVGSGDLSLLIEMAIKELNKSDIVYSHSNAIQESAQNTIILFTGEGALIKASGNDNIIDIHDELAKILI